MQAEEAARLAAEEEAARVAAEYAPPPPGAQRPLGCARQH